MADDFDDYQSGLDSPAIGAAVVTPSDDTDLPKSSRALYIGSSGNITVTMKDGVDCTFSNVVVGTMLPIRATRVKATGTTATNIVAMY